MLIVNKIDRLRKLILIMEIAAGRFKLQASDFKLQASGYNLEAECFKLQFVQTSCLKE